MPSGSTRKSSAMPGSISSTKRRGGERHALAQVRPPPGECDAGGGGARHEERGGDELCATHGVLPSIIAAALRAAPTGYAVAKPNTTQAATISHAGSSMTAGASPGGGVRAPGSER